MSILLLYVEARMKVGIFTHLFGDADPTIHVPDVKGKDNNIRL